MSETELPHIGLRRRVPRNFVSGGYELIEPDTHGVAQRKAESVRKPMERSFVLKEEGKNPTELRYKPLQKDIDVLEQEGFTPGNLRYVLCNGVYIEAGRQTPEGALRARFDKKDGTLIDPPEIDPNIFPNLSVALRIPVETIRLADTFFLALRNLNTPQPNDFPRVMSVVDAALQTPVITAQRKMF